MIYNTEIHNDDAVPIPYTVSESGNMLELAQIFNGSPLRLNASRIRVDGCKLIVETDKKELGYIFNPRYSNGLRIERL
jgi:hypothetical protein